MALQTHKNRLGRRDAAGAREAICETDFCWWQVGGEGCLIREFEFVGVFVCWRGWECFNRLYTGDTWGDEVVEVVRGEDGGHGPDGGALHVRLLSFVWLFSDNRLLKLEILAINERIIKSLGWSKSEVVDL